MGPKANSVTAKPAAKNSAADESSSSSSSSKRKRDNEEEKDVAAGIPTSGRERSYKSSKEVPNGRFYMKWECETSMHREDDFLMSSRYPEPCLNGMGRYVNVRREQEGKKGKGSQREDGKRQKRKEGKGKSQNGGS